MVFLKLVIGLILYSIGLVFLYRAMVHVGFEHSSAMFTVILTFLGSLFKIFED